MNKWNVINNIFPTDEMRHSTEEENKLYSDMLERKSKTMEEYNKDNRIMNRIEVEIRAIHKIQKIAESYFNKQISKEEFDRKIDSMVYDVFTELDLILLRETFYRYKTFASKSWSDYDVVGMQNEL